MKIVDVQVQHISQSLWGFLAKREETLPLVTPLDIYADFQATRGSWFWDEGMAVVRVVAEDGTVGHGWCEDGCRTIAPIIDSHLSRLLLDQSHGEIEGLWDRMYRASIPYGRKGTAMMAISAIDIALWDLLGKVTGKPVYELLGGPVRKTIPVYASALHPVGSDRVAAEAQAYVAGGYRTMKARFPFGPGAGVDGMVANVEHLRNIRDAIGPDIDLAADAYMGWDLNYALRMVDKLEPLRLAWIEEPFIPDDLRSYARLRRESPIPISGGEHEFTRYGFQQIIDAEAMDIVQPDLRRCGGFTEAKKICALAATAGLTVIPHAYGITHLHLAAATPSIPMAEYFPLPCWADPAPDDYPPVFVGEPEPDGDARVRLSFAPGLGVYVNESLCAD